MSHMNPRAIKIIILCDRFVRIGVAENYIKSLAFVLQQIANQYRLLGYVISTKPLPPLFFNDLREDLADSLQFTTPADKALIESVPQNGCQSYYSP